VEISAEHYTSDASALLLPPDVIFVNIFQQNTEFFNRHCTLSSDPSNSLTIDRRQNIFEWGDLQTVFPKPRH